MRIGGTMENIIEVKNICKSFGCKENRTQVLDNISLTVEKGEFLSLMGASGSGKSTLLYLIGGLDTPDSGEILLNGRDIAKLRDKELSKLRREGMGFVFQFFNLVQNLTVEDNILLPLVMEKTRKNTVKGLIRSSKQQGFRISAEAIPVNYPAVSSRDVP